MQSTRFLAISISIFSLTFVGCNFTKQSGDFSGKNISASSDSRNLASISAAPEEKSKTVAEVPKTETTPKGDETPNSPTSKDTPKLESPDELANIESKDEGGIIVYVKAMLEGPYDSKSQTMTSKLNELELIPLEEPYSGQGHKFIGGGGEFADKNVIYSKSDCPIIDWVFIELRHEKNPLDIVASRSALITCKGDVVDTDGKSGVKFKQVSDGNYYVSLHHRTHLAVITANAVSLSLKSDVIDFYSGKVAYGDAPLLDVGENQVLWAGDANGDHYIKYTGSGNEKDMIFVAIGGQVPTNVVSGYMNTDINCDGKTKYTGTQNDRDIVLKNVLGSNQGNYQRIGGIAQLEKAGQ